MQLLPCLTQVAAQSSAAVQGNLIHLVYGAGGAIASLAAHDLVTVCGVDAQRVSCYTCAPLAPVCSLYSLELGRRGSNCIDVRVRVELLSTFQSGCASLDRLCSTCMASATAQAASSSSMQP